MNSLDGDNDSDDCSCNSLICRVASSRAREDIKRQNQFRFYVDSTNPNLCLPVAAAITSSSSDGDVDNGSSSDMSIDSGYTVIHQDRRLLTNKEESNLKLILHGPAMISEGRVEEKVDRILQHVLTLARNKRTTPYIAIEVRLVLLCFVHN